MVQLSDDSVHGNMLTLANARAKLAELFCTTIDFGSAENIDLFDCFGRILAQDVKAHTAVPRFQNSAVDGFSFSNSDLSKVGAKTSFLLQSDKIFAGDTPPPPLLKGHAIQITTGAPIPQGADSVCMFEDAVIDEHKVHIPNALKSGSNLRPKGEDFEANSSILCAGQRLSARHLSALIATDSPRTLAVFPKLRILVCSTGDEIHSKNTEMVADSNGPMLVNLFRKSWGFDTILHHRTLPDDLAQLTAFFQETTPKYDCIVTTGAVSTGERDYLKDAFADAGGTMDFWRIAIKPGRPVAVGHMHQCVWVGLPGNPVAALVTALEVALPALRIANGERSAVPPKGYWINLNSEVQKKPGRREFLRVKLLADSETKNRPDATKFHKIGAGMISGLLWSDGLAQIPEQVINHKSGDAVWFIPWEAYRL